MDAVESGGDRRDARLVLSEVIDLLEVVAQQSLVGVSGPLRHSLELLAGEGRDLAIDVESGAIGRGSSQPVVDEPVERVCETAALAQPSTESQRSR